MRFDCAGGLSWFGELLSNRAYARLRVGVASQLGGAEFSPSIPAFEWNRRLSEFPKNLAKTRWAFPMGHRRGSKGS